MIFITNLFEIDRAREVLKKKDFVLHDPKTKNPVMATKIAKGSVIMSKCIIGRGTKINGPITIKNGFFEIGNFCAVGFDVKVIGSNHSLSSPCVQVGLVKEVVGDYKRDKIQGVYVGNNVWIGDDVILLPGVRVGDGAIIGAGSVVSKDVQPYTVVAGNPAKVVKERDGKERVKCLSESRFWDKSLEWMKSNPDLFRLKG